MDVHERRLPPSQRPHRGALRDKPNSTGRVERKTGPSVALGSSPPALSRDQVSGVDMVKNTTWDCSRLIRGIAAGSLVVLVAVSGKPAAAQSADAQERCTEDVMRLCSEFVPDADSIVVCLKAKRLQLTSSCLNALAPAPLASQVSPTKNLQKARRTVSPADAARSTRIQHQAAATR